METTFDEKDTQKLIQAIKNVRSLLPTTEEAAQNIYKNMRKVFKD